MGFDKEQTIKFLSKFTDLTTFSGQVSLTMAANLVIAALGMLTGILAARLLGPTGRGELAAIQAAPSILASFAMLGIPEALVYFSSREPRHSGNFLASGVVIAGGGAVVVFGLGWFILPFFLQAQSPLVVKTARIFLLGITAAYLLGGIPHQALRAGGSWRAWNFIRILPNSLWLVALAAFVLIPAIVSPQNIAYAFIFGQLLIIFPVFFFVQNKISRPLFPQRSYFKPMFLYGLPSALSLLPQTLNLRLDQMMMSAYLPPNLLGQYVVAVSWAGAAAPMINAVGPVLFPHLSSIKGTSGQIHFLGKVTNKFSFIVLGLTVCIALITPFAIPFLFGEDYRAAVTPALILVAANGILSLNTLFGDALKGLGLPGKVLIADTIGLVVTVILLFLLLPRLKIIGAAITSLAAYTMVCLSLYRFIKSFQKRVEV